MKVIALLSFAASLTAATIAVDQPSGWYRYDVSHHGKHAQMGAVVGIAGWATGYALDCNRTGRIAIGTGSALAVGIGHEVARGKGSTLIDPIDAAWTGVGGLASSLLCELGYSMISVATTADSAAVGVAWRF